MKNLIIILSFLIFHFSFSQSQKFEDIEERIVEKLNKIKAEDPNLEIAKIIFEEFKTSGKEKEEDLYTISTGIKIESDFRRNIEPGYAKFDVDDEQINILDFYPFTGKENIKIYFDTYISQFEKLGTTKVFQQLMKEKSVVYFPLEQGNKNEYIFRDEHYIYFIRGNDEWRFVIAAFDNYHGIEDMDIRFFAFRKTFSGEDVFKSGSTIEEMEKRRTVELSKEEKEREQFPLFHDIRTNEIKFLLKDLKFMDSKYESDTVFQKHYEKLIQEEDITRFNLGLFVSDFEYFLTLDLSDFKNQSDYSFENDVLNIQHLSAHALADYYRSVYGYEKAIEFYKKSLTEFPYTVSSGTTFLKDAERILFDIHKSYYNWNKKDEAFGYLLGLIIDSNNFTETASEQLLTYLNKENQKITKKEVDNVLNSIKIKDKSLGLYTFQFKGKEIWFLPPFFNSLEEIRNTFKNSEFYKKLY